MQMAMYALSERLREDLQTGFLSRMKKSCRYYGNGHLFGAGAILLSLAGCEQQDRHRDYWQKWLQEPTNPIVAVVCLQDGGLLHLWERSWTWNSEEPDNRNLRTISMKAGDVVFFDAAILHCGAAYASSHLRVHYYGKTNSVTYPVRKIGFVPVNVV
jgi:hypothetical protein